jgi:hypothetical protein
MAIRLRTPHFNSRSDVQSRYKKVPKGDEGFSLTHVIILRAENRILMQSAPMMADDPNKMTEEINNGMEYKVRSLVYKTS